MPIALVVINNSGIGVGLPLDGDSHEERVADSPVTSLTQHARYDQVGRLLVGSNAFCIHSLHSKPWTVNTIHPV